MSNKIVLLVDDDDMVNLIVETVLVRNGYQVLTARTGRESLALLDQNLDTIEVALIDIDLAGGMGGFELAERLRSKHPQLKIIFSTGHDIETVAENAAFIESAGFLQKPYNIPSLLGKILEALNG